MRLGLPTDHPKVKHIAIALRESVDALDQIIDPEWGWGEAKIYIEKWHFVNTSHTRQKKPRNWDLED